MAKFRKPFYKKSHKSWYVQLDGKQIRLGPDKDEAFDRYHELMREKKRAAKLSTPQLHKEYSLGLLYEEFLVSAFLERSSRTKDFYIEKLAPFVNFMGEAFVAVELKPFHVEQWIAKHPHWKKGTARTVWQAVQRLMRWGKKSGRIGHSLVCDYQKPGPGRRTRVITPHEYANLIMANIPSEPFRQLITVAWECGARPQEFLKAEVRHYDAEGKRIVLPPEEAKGKQWPRIIYLSDKAIEVVEKLIAQHGSGRIFRNKSGRAWTVSSVNGEWCRLQHRLGFQVMKDQGTEPSEDDIKAKLSTLSPTKRNGKAKTASELREEARLKVRKKMASKLAPKFCMYNFRHSWLDRMLKAGVDALTCAILLGHRDPSMVARTYQHLSQSPDYLRAALKRVSG
jgi:hypothetical protein